MRIAHVTATYPPHNTGTGNVARRNARELARRGHDVHVFTAAIPGALVEERHDGVTIHRLRPAVRYGNAAFLPSLVTRLRRFELIHLHMPFYGGSEAIYLLKRLGRIPLVITHHQDVHLGGPAGLVNRLHDRLLGRRLMQHADRTCFTSLDYARASRFAPLLRDGRTEVAELPNGVDPDFFTPGPRPAHLVETYGLAGKQALLFVGVLDRAHYFKGVDNLLRAVAALADPNLELIVVGQGDMQAEYRQLAMRLGLAAEVHFPGFVPDGELPAYYRLADATVLPSTTAGEAFGLVLLESLACATPVVASALPGVRTVVADGENGFLAEPGSPEALAAQLGRLLSLSPARREAMGAAGRRKVEQRYAWNRIGDQLDELYHQVAGRQRTTAAEATS